MASPAADSRFSDKPKPPPDLRPWACPRQHKLALVALTPGSRIAVWCRECRQWYEKEQAA